MASSIGAGYVAVFAVSGSVVLLALQLHKRLLSDFMKQMEFEIANFHPGVIEHVMASSIGAGYVAVFAVSGSVVLLAFQLHKRLLSDFMKQMEFEIGSTKSPGKKKVRFADALEAQRSPSDDGKAHRKMHQPPRPAGGRLGSPDQKLDSLPLNWQILYKGIIQYKNSNFRGPN